MRVYIPACARALSPRVDSSARGDRPHGHRHLLSIPAHGPARTVFAISASTSGLMLAATARSQSKNAGPYRSPCRSRSATPGWPGSPSAPRPVRRDKARIPIPAIKCLFSRLFNGAQGRNRTTDTVIFSHRICCLRPSLAISANSCKRHVFLTLIETRVSCVIT
jgi:hypothetical protein